MLIAETADNGIHVGIGTHSDLVIMFSWVRLVITRTLVLVKALMRVGRKPSSYLQLFSSLFIWPICLLH
jgi:hypothetical protein